MKNSLLPLLVCCAFWAFGQKSFFGIEAGVNIANQRIVSNAISNNVTVLNSANFLFNKPEPAFGVFYQLQLSEKTGIRAGARYMGLGYKSKTDSVNNVNINYLTFPLTFHHNVNKHLSFNAGGYVSFTLGGTKINNKNITETYHKNDFGISIGGTHDIYKNFSIAINYIIGLKNIWLKDNSTIGYGVAINSKYTNRALQFALIYKLKKTI